jgi:hypothetical protein
LLAGAVIAAGVFFRPPYLWEQTTYLINEDSNVPHRAGAQIAPAGHHWIWAPPEGKTEQEYYPDKGRTIHVARIDWERTGVYAGVPFALFALAAYVARGPKKRENI